MEAKEQIISEFLSAHNLATARGETCARVEGDPATPRNIEEYADYCARMVRRYT